MSGQQLLLFDPEDKPRVRVRVPCDPEQRRRRREAKQRLSARIRLLPAVALFIASDGSQSAYSPTDPRTPTIPPDVSPPEEARKLSYAERLERKRKQLEKRKDRMIRRRVRRIFALCDLPPEWIHCDDLRAMDAEIERAKREVQAIWSENEERKRRIGLNATEKDPHEHWTPPFAAASEHCHEGTE